MTAESDHLLATIRQLVRGRVHPAQEDVVVEAVARTVVTVMTTPEYYNHLRIVIDLQAENWKLRQQVLHLQRLVQAFQAGPVVTVKKAKRKAVARKKAPVRKVAAPRKVPASNVRAFKRGLSGQ